MVARRSPLLNEADVWQILEGVKDPEIPVISVVELGIIRQVEVSEDRVRVAMIPTFSGCPALDRMRQDIREALLASGAAEVEVTVLMSPRWSSDDIQPAGRRKLKAFGLAPPPHAAAGLDSALLEIVHCPYCGSLNTSLQNSFGPTLCRAIFTCNDCRQPFEQFKPL